MINEELDIWWNELDFKTLESITRLKHYHCSDDDGYQDFVDACDNWWKGLDKEEKHSIFNEYV